MASGQPGLPQKVASGQPNRWPQYDVMRYRVFHLLMKFYICRHFQANVSQYNNLALKYITVILTKTFFTRKLGTSRYRSVILCVENVGFGRLLEQAE